MVLDIVSIVFVAVTMNHLGLVGKIEGIMGFQIPILNCPKCLSCWCTVIYLTGIMGFTEIPQIPSVLAISFLSSYLAIWLELLEGYIDTLYMKLYGKITSAYTDDADSSDAEDGDSGGSMSELPENGKNNI